DRAGVAEQRTPAPDAAAVPRGAVAVDGAVVDRHATADVQDAATGPIEGEVAIDRTVVDGDRAGDGENTAPQPDGAAVAIADLLVGLVAIDLAPSGDRNRGQEGADAAARHQEARGLGQLVHGTPEEGGGLTGGPFDLAEGAEHVGAARAAHRGRKVGELRGRGDEAETDGDRLAEGLLVGQGVAVELAAVGA